MRQSNGIPAERLSDAARAVISLLAPMEVVPVLIGGCALAARGVCHATSDVDLLVECDQSKLREIAKRVAAAGHQIDALSEQALRDGESAELRFYREGMQFDLIPIAHAREKHVYARATIEPWFRTSMRIACLVDVIIEKLRTGRASNLEQVAPTIRAKLSDCQRREGLRDCHDLGLMTTCGTLIRDVFED